MSCEFVIACTLNGGIGKGNNLPWPRLKEDMEHFKAITTGKHVLMGRGTWDSLPDVVRPLPNRHNIILTSEPSKIQQHDNVSAYSSIDEAMESINGDIMYVIGGAEVYRKFFLPQYIHYITRIHLTYVFQDFDCDVFIPLHSMLSEFEFDNIGIVHTTEKDNIPFQINSLIRKKETKQSHEEYQYLNLISEILKNGNIKGDRTGTGTISLFGKQSKYNLRESFPLLTTKKVFWRGVAEELLWLIRGSTSSIELSDKKVHIWDGNGSKEFLIKSGFPDREEGDLGPVYGFQWRYCGANYIDHKTDYKGQGIDQLQQVINQIKNNPNDRRIIMSSWIPNDIPNMSLPPCHILCQFYVANGELSCQLYQRSCDLGLGVPFNIASYSLLTYMIAHVCDLKPGEFIHTMGDTHIYLNHVNALKEQLKRNPKEFPTLSFKRKVSNIDDFTFDDFLLEGYKPHSSIKMKMAV